MVQEIIASRNIADNIVEHLEQMILEGAFALGSKLPSERKLAEQFGVSRPSIREALKKLAVKGLVISRHGKGTFINETIGRIFKDPIVNLYEESPDAQRDLLEFRHTLEASCAYYAAQRATPVDLEKLTDAFLAIERCYSDSNTTQQQEADADAHFHLVIAEASHNMVLLQIIRMLFDLVKQNIVTSIGGLHAFNSKTRDQLMGQHKRLYDAIMQRDADEAKRAASQHIHYVCAVLDEMKEEQRRLNQSVRRQQVIG